MGLGSSWTRFYILNYLKALFLKLQLHAWFIACCTSFPPHPLEGSVHLYNSICCLTLFSLSLSVTLSWISPPLIILKSCSSHTLMVTRDATFWDKLHAATCQTQTSTDGKNKDAVHNIEPQTHRPYTLYAACRSLQTGAVNDTALFWWVFLWRLTVQTKCFVTFTSSHFNSHQAYGVLSQEDLQKTPLLRFSPALMLIETDGTGMFSSSSSL